MGLVVHRWYFPAKIAAYFDHVKVPGELFYPRFVRITRPPPNPKLIIETRFIIITEIMEGKTLGGFVLTCLWGLIFLIHNVRYYY